MASEGDITKLEHEFEELMRTVGEEIGRKLGEATRLLNEVCDLSDTHGIPFEGAISHIGQPYIPSSFSEKFGKLDTERVAELTGVSSYSLDDGYRGGWAHSEIC